MRACESCEAIVACWSGCFLMTHSREHFASPPADPTCRPNADHGPGTRTGHRSDRIAAAFAGPEAFCTENVADRFGISRNAASQALKRLHRAGRVVRVEMDQYLVKDGEQ
jgi:biotin operon repressor